MEDFQERPGDLWWGMLVRKRWSEVPEDPDPFVVQATNGPSGSLALETPDQLGYDFCQRAIQSPFLGFVEPVEDEAPYLLYVYGGRPDCELVSGGREERASETSVRRVGRATNEAAPFKAAHEMRESREF